MNKQLAAFAVVIAILAVPLFVPAAPTMTNPAVVYIKGYISNYDTDTYPAGPNLDNQKVLDDLKTMGLTTVPVISNGQQTGYLKVQNDATIKLYKVQNVEGSVLANMFLCSQDYPNDGLLSTGACVKSDPSKFFDSIAIRDGVKTYYITLGGFVDKQGADFYLDGKKLQQKLVFRSRQAPGGDALGLPIGILSSVAGCADYQDGKRVCVRLEGQQNDNKSYKVLSEWVTIKGGTASNAAADFGSCKSIAECTAVMDKKLVNSVFN